MIDPSRSDPPAIVQGTETLENMAKLINSEHAVQENAARDSAKRAKRIGDMLAEAKARCGHGEWMKWLKDNIRFSGSLARRYMRVSANWSKLEPGSNLATIYQFLASDGGEAEEAEENQPPSLEDLTPQAAPLCPKCARKVRVHGQPPDSGCPDCRELRKKNTTKPTVRSGPSFNGAPIPTWDELMRLSFGPFVRQIDSFFKVIHRSNKLEHNGLIRRVSELKDQLKAVYKKYTKGRTE